MTQEHWKPIPGFTNYEVSDQGRIYNKRTGQMMKVSNTAWGTIKISLVPDLFGERVTVGVKYLVAEAFVLPPNARCDKVMILDGDRCNLRAENLMWRPWSFVWKYAYQLKVDQPLHYHNLSVMNVATGKQYSSIIEAGMTEGLLFDDIWRSTYTAAPIFPYGSVFEVLQRV